MPNVYAPLTFPTALLCAVLTAFVVATPLLAPGQSMPSTTVIIDPTPPAPSQPYLDRKVGSSLEKFSRWKAQMKKEHFTAYLSTYNGILAGLTGLFFGLAAYRLGDPMSPYRVVRRRTLQLAIAIGGSLGILVAVMQVPPHAPDKVSLLLLAIVTGAVGTLIGSWIAFRVMRILSNRSARRDGRHLTDRMRHA